MCDCHVVWRLNDLPLPPPHNHQRSPLANDFSVIWRSEAFGHNRVGHIRLAAEHAEADRWEWSINPPMPVPAWGRGIARSRDLATAAFRRALENFHRETTACQ